MSEDVFFSEQNLSIKISQKDLSDFLDYPIIFSLPGQSYHKSYCQSFGYIAHYPKRKKEYHVRRYKRSCYRRDCDQCYKDWAKRESINISLRILEYELQRKKKPIHVVLSPPQDVKYDTMSSFKMLRKRAYKIALKIGIEGGVLIFHERAIRYVNKEEYLKHHDYSEGPHFHILGFGWILQGRVKDLFRKEGWIVKNLGVRKSVKKTAEYILSHSVRGEANEPAEGILPISQSMKEGQILKHKELHTETWFGTLSYNKFHAKIVKGGDSIYCALCDCEVERSNWWLVSWAGQGPPPDSDFFAEPFEVLDTGLLKIRLRFESQLGDKPYFYM